MTWNDLSPTESHWMGKLAQLEAVVQEALIHRNAHWKTCTHRMREEEPFVNTYNGAEIYPDHPTCLLCGDEFEMDAYCVEAPDFICRFQVEGFPEPMTGDQLDSLWTRESYWNKTKEEQAVITDAPCIHCEQPWERSR